MGTQGIDRSNRKEPRRGVCDDCLWLCGPLRNGCDHEQVSGGQRPWRVPTIKARANDGPCGPQARYWEAR